MHLHIVSFNVPWPADYGGVIDVYYRIVALAKAGVHIHLHCYTYGRTEAKELNQWCEEVLYYPRETTVCHQLERRPYIVASRNSKQLVERLKQDDYPILLEGLHNGFVLEQLAGQGRKISVRAHNVEHDYYHSLAHAEKSMWKRLFFLAESHKLRRYEPVLQRATAVLAISEADAAHFRSLGCRQVVVLPPSHGNDAVTSLTGRGNYVLYHGNLSVPENVNACLYLLDQVAAHSPYQFILAGRQPSPELQKAASQHSNVRLVTDPDDATMRQLLQEAQVNLLVTQQATGAKLKLMNALYNGRYCMVNSAMVQGTPLAEACIVADTPETINSALTQLMDKDFTEEERQKRIQYLATADPQQDLKALLF